MSDIAKDAIAMFVTLFFIGGLFAFIAVSAEKDRDDFRRECRARGGVPIIEREYKCMNQEMFK